VGTARCEEDLAQLLETRVDIEFDPDIYGIVRSFTAKHRARVMPAPVPRVTEDAAEALLPS
jgi:hypothetical protein